MRLSLHTKLLLSYITLIAIITGSIHLYLTRSLQEDLYDRTRQALLTDTRLAQAYFEASLPDTLTYHTVDPICDHLGAQSGARVTIVTMEGRVMGDSSIPTIELPGIENHATRPEIIEAHRTSVGQSLRYSETVNIDMAYAAVPFMLSGQRAGVVRLALPVQGFDWIEDQISRIVIFAGLSGLVLAIVSSYATSRLVSRPIERMTDFAEQLADGNYSATTSAPGHSELQMLAVALNDMGSQSRARLDQITKENAQLEAVLSSMTDGLMVTDTKGRIILTNPAFQSTAGGFPSEPEGLTPGEIFGSRELQDAVDHALEADGSGGGVSSLEITLEEGARVLDVHLTPIHIDRSANGLVAVFHDISELRRLEQIRSEFVANVSHELRTPLTSIRGYTETLLDGALEEPHAARKFLSSLQNHVNRLQALVEDLLQLSKLESGNVEPEFHACDIGYLAISIEESLEARLRSRNLEFKLENSTTRKARGDEYLLEQVLYNLVDNAIKYTPEGGSITVRAYEQADTICLEVEDTGIGIPAESLPRVFERFYRVDRARSREMGGTGLGLSIVKHAMETHGGKLDVQSVVGKGTKFTLSLPLMDDEDTI